MPFVPGAPRSPVRAHTTITPAWSPLVIHCFCAVEHPAVAVALGASCASPPGSLPAPGSLERERARRVLARGEPRAAALASARRCRSAR